MTFEAWIVVVVPFPFIDVPHAKPRPAVVLSNRVFNENHGHCLLAMITTAARSKWASDHEIKELAEAGLHVPCVVRLKLFTLENRLIGRQIGVLGKMDRAAIGKQIRDMIG